MSNYILTRIEAIQQELEMLKQKVLLQGQGEAKKEHSPQQLKGIWKGVKISEQMFEEAERSLMFKDFEE
jgi:hypothetical protein